MPVIARYRLKCLRGTRACFRILRLALALASTSSLLVNSLHFGSSSILNLPVQPFALHLSGRPGVFPSFNVDDVMKAHVFIFSLAIAYIMDGCVFNLFAAQ
jgi:hypothetical protein